MDESGAGAADLSLQEIQEILAEEQENRDMLRVRHGKEMMKSLLSNSLSGSFDHDRSKSETNDAASNTGNLDISITEEATPPVGEFGHLTKETVVDLRKKAIVASSSQSHFSAKLGKISSNLRRRRRHQPALQNRTSTNAFKIQTSIQDYWSWKTVSGYIIAASILSLVSFLTAFLLLSWYSAQIHSHDTEIFKLKEKQVIGAQEALEKYQLHKENLMEAIMHPSLKESKKWQSLLQSCHLKRDELQEQIAKQSQDGGKHQMKLEAVEAELERQRKEIQGLQEMLKDLQGQNMEPRKETGQNVNSSLPIKFILAFWDVFTNCCEQISFGILCLSVRITRWFFFAMDYAMLQLH